MLNLVAIAALLVAAAAPAPPGRCPALPRGAMQPLFAIVAGDAVAAQPVPVRADAVLAAETQHLGEDTRRTLAPVAVGGGRFGHVFPAGSIVNLVRASSGDHLCFVEAARAGQGPQAHEFLTCLVDRDGDGSHERARMVGIYRGTAHNLAMTWPARLEALHPRDAATHIAATRRVRVAALTGDTARLVVEHRVSLRGRDAAWTEKPSLRRDVALVDGRVEQVGGLDFRVGRGPAGWTLTPLQQRFPAWVSFGCDGEATVGGPG